MQTTSLVKHRSLRLRALRRVPGSVPTCCSLLLALFLFGNTPAAGWWGSGHSHITSGAIGHLPQPLRGFFEDNIDSVTALSAFEPPGKHYINIDAYPEFFAGTFPRDLDDLISLYGSSTVDQFGMGPWTYADYVETLSNGMAAATTEQDMLDLLPTAAALAHFIEDLHNPLHLTLNYNGQLTGNNGIHARYEGEMIVRHFGDLTFSQANAAYLPSVIDFVFDGIDAHYPFVDDILSADTLYAGPHNEAYYAGLWNETGAFSQSLFQEASEAVADSWYTAWVNAGSPTTFLEDDADFDDDGDVDDEDLSDWETFYGSSDQGDADFDGDSDGADFLIWQQQYTGSFVQPLSDVAVPEPAGSVLLVLAAVGGLAQRVRIRRT